MDKDLEHLRILSICYYVGAGITALFSCFPLIHFFVGVSMMISGLTKTPSESGDINPLPIVGLIFVCASSAVILVGWTIAICTFYAGKSIGQRKNYVFCLVMAGISCASFPIGTTLGVFTFIVLLRDSVKPLFNGKSTQNFNSFGDTPETWR